MTEAAQIDVEKYGPWAVIAGGSEGPGAEFAVQLAEAGINSVIVARKPEPLAETAERVRAAGAEVRVVELDLLRPDATEELRRSTDDLDVGLFIYNAGANTYGAPFVESDMDRVQQVIDLNITTMLAMTRHYSERLVERGRGGIIQVSSMSGYYGTAQIGIYASVKAFGRIFSESLWVELKDRNIDVLGFVLGATDTPAMKRAGFDFKKMGMNPADPADVAREGLANITNGPVHIMSGNEASAERIQRTDRRAMLLGE